MTKPLFEPGTCLHEGSSKLHLFGWVRTANEEGKSGNGCHANLCVNVIERSRESTLHRWQGQQLALIDEASRDNSTHLLSSRSVCFACTVLLRSNALFFLFSIASSISRSFWTRSLADAASPPALKSFCVCMVYCVNCGKRTRRWNS